MTSTIPAALRRAADSFGSAPALGPLSWRALRDEVRRVARALIAGGLRPGDRLALWAPNSVEWVLTALGVSWAGGTLVPVNTRFTAVEARDVIDRSGARALVVVGPFLGTDRLAALRAATGALPDLVVSVPDGWAGFVASGDAVPASEADARAAAVRPDDVADILFTSGTTGRSKGVMSAHRQSLAVAEAWAGIAGLGPDDRYLVVNPFFHSFGLKAGILACLVSGATIVPQAVFDVARVLEVIGTERITVLPGPPTLYTSLLDHPAAGRYDLSSLRLAVTGAATVPPALVERMREELGAEVLTAYGLTEAVVATMCRPGDDARTVAGTCGRAAAGFEIRIAEPDGQVLLRGPNTMLGYLDDPAATAEAIDADGWLHTGDVGRLDEHGYLTITDRLKDMFICGGFNVYPAEVERVLAQLPQVAESAVIGVPDRRLGEVGRAFVVCRPGRAVTGPEVIEFCRGRLAGYKIPRSVELRDELPHNASGKVRKYLLRAEAADG
ncbi:acyl-CoA synthetase (AMP-forming)/AMP-acid ligase II [Actinoplanes octamycinicus]|uniref:Acyl-CoA synthetase (AMP-forming)/AMP-acid ligase II n=1 Tax=Actinoplanes octamycinicus TaxID=135948 RepID=A0A7W7H731_9ACTN|nr:FadD3 family acyl-CoA ligase [Actinoplanes octamycinicus]MBB4745221.1 acyl-CoA synthetase (AMP-forming)/AMP-acid ligase II [Actinoplanes octamycinicus]GIE62652.1 acyl-CoA synthetase [Actinoplanes octamycinicus]